MSSEQSSRVMIFVIYGFDVTMLYLSSLLQSTLSHHKIVMLEKYIQLLPDRVESVVKRSSEHIARKYERVKGVLCAIYC